MRTLPIENPTRTGPCPGAARSTTSVLIVDDHPMMRSALALAVRQAAPEAEILEAGSMKEALAALAKRTPSLVLLDLRLPGGEKFSGIRDITSLPSAPPVVVVSAHEEEVIVRNALRQGAIAFLRKSLPFEEISATIRKALAGTLESQAEDSARDADPHGLTPAQTLVLEGLREGKSNKQIAFELGLVEATVKAHLTAIFRKLGVLNRTQALLAVNSDLA